MMHQDIEPTITYAEAIERVLGQLDDIHSAVALRNQSWGDPATCPDLGGMLQDVFYTAQETLAELEQARGGQSYELQVIGREGRLIRLGRRQA
jgi:hypothetical protein